MKNAPRGTPEAVGPEWRTLAATGESKPVHPVTDAYLLRRIHVLTQQGDHDTARFLGELRALLMVQGLADTLTVAASVHLADFYSNS